MTSTSVIFYLTIRTPYCMATLPVLPLGSAGVYGFLYCARKQLRSLTYVTRCFAIIQKYAKLWWATWLWSSVFRLLYTKELLVSLSWCREVSNCLCVVAMESYAAWGIMGTPSLDKALWHTVGTDIFGPDRSFMWWPWQVYVAGYNGYERRKLLTGESWERCSPRVEPLLYGTVWDVVSKVGPRCLTELTLVQRIFRSRQLLRNRVLLCMAARAVGARC